MNLNLKPQVFLCTCWLSVLKSSLLKVQSQEQVLYNSYWSHHRAKKGSYLFLNLTVLCRICQSGALSLPVWLTLCASIRCRAEKIHFDETRLLSYCVSIPMDVKNICCVRAKIFFYCDNNYFSICT